MKSDGALIALTTSSHVVISSDENISSIIDWAINDIPVCVSKIQVHTRFDTVDLGLSKVFSESIIHMMSDVHISPDIRYIFIGSDFRDESTGLIIYQETDQDPKATDFFKRWEEINQMFFEIVIFGKSLPGKDPEIIVCVNGIWDGESWRNVHCLNQPMICIIENP